MDLQKEPKGSLLAALTAALALAMLAAPYFPRLFPLVLVGAAPAACALVLARRPSRPLRTALVGVAVWLSLGLGGAWALGGEPVLGFAWVLLVLFALPLPLLPWVYARTFPGRREPRLEGPGADAGRGE